MPVTAGLIPLRKLLISRTRYGVRNPHGDLAPKPAAGVLPAVPDRTQMHDGEPPR